MIVVLTLGDERKEFIAPGWVRLGQIALKYI
jgi:hypothetical protein